MLSAKDLIERERVKRQVKKELYTKILTLLCRKIDLAHTVGRDRILVKIPEFIVGYPVYNMDTVTVYMHRQLQRLGYSCSIISSGYIHVLWKDRDARTSSSSSLVVVEDLPSLSNLKKAANTIRKKYT